MCKISNKVLDVEEVFEESGRSLKFSFGQSIIFPIHGAWVVSGTWLIEQYECVIVELHCHLIL